MTASETVPFDPDGTDYHTFRIPALLAIPRLDLTSGDGRPGTAVLLAFCEGRRTSASDIGEIDVLLRRSLDAGRSWEPLQVVASASGKTCGNPVPILDPASGDVVLLSVQNGAEATAEELGGGTATAENARRVFVQRSSDLGQTWTERVEITAQVKRADWSWYATGPCHGIALTGGEHRGRLVAPANHNRVPDPGAGDPDHPRYNGGHCIVSDDGGHSWRRGFVDENDQNRTNANESTVAELADGRLVFNARNYKADGAPRLQAISADAGATLDAPYDDATGITAPDIQGAMITTDGEQLLLSTPAHEHRRKDLTVFVCDDLDHWRPGALIKPGPAGYSDLAMLGPDRVGLLYEAGESGSHDQIRFADWPLAELLRADEELREGTDR
jgi:sialidase-1